MHDLPPSSAAQVRPGRRIFGAAARDRLLILGLALLVQAPGLLGWIDSDPLPLLSALRQGGAAGLWPGYPGWVDPNVAFTTQTLGHLAASSWLAGQVPWWNPYSGIGVPLAAEMQPAALFLPFVLLLRMANGLLWLRAAMCAVAGLGTYELLRTLGLRRAACLAGGILFAFNGTLAWLPHGPDRVSAFLPVILLGIERARLHAATGRRFGWGLIAVGLAFSLYAGFPETAYLGGLLAAAWTLWRLARPDAPADRRWAGRRVLLGKVLAGLATGLLLAIPVVLPFAEFLPLADVGFHVGVFAHAALPRAAFAMILLPYVYGPIFAFGGQWPDGPSAVAWGTIGGYVGAAAAALALAALLRRRGRESGLRWLLALWIAACLAKTANVPGLTAAVNVIPMVPLVAFFRYAEPTWQLAAAILAAFAIDDWLRLGAARGRTAVAMLLGLLLLGLLLLGLAVWIAAPLVRELWHLPGYRRFPTASVAWATLVLLGLPVLMSGPARRWRQATVLLLVGLDAVAMFAVPLGSSTRGATVDAAPIAFLRSHLGLQRFYALAAIPPNYGALFGIAHINDNMLPVPRAWARHITQVLDPLADPISFTGTSGGRGPGSTPQDMVLQRLDAYRALAVRYVVTARGDDSFSKELATGRMGPGGVPVRLPAGAGQSGELPARFAKGRIIDGLGVAIGTYGGRADGALVAELCGHAGCARGRAELQGALDDAVLDVALSPPLPTAPDEALRFTLMHEGGTAPVAVWLMPGSLARADGSWPAGLGPLLTLSYEAPGSPLVRVFRDPHVDIFELPGAAPYFSAGPACALAAPGRRAVAATCTAPAILTRRELSFPGWTVTINGVPAPLGSRGIVQTLGLPAGRSVVRFVYAPPHIGLAYAAFALGVLWLLAAWVSERRRGMGWRGAERPL